MALEFVIRENTSTGDATTRYEAGDVIEICDIPDGTPSIALPHNSPFRIVRVATAKHRVDVKGYLVPKTTGGNKKRLYYLDTTRMSAADLATWNANRYVETTEAVALGWVRSK